MFKSLLLITGLVIYAYFHVTRCDPLTAGYINNSNQLMPYFVLITLRFLPGFAGLYISAVFSGALSTLSSGINSLAANTVEDFFHRFLRNKSESTVTTVTKLMVCFYGCAAIAIAYVTKDFQGPVSQINYTIMGAISGPVLGLFVLGATFPQANYGGTLIGCCVGFLVSAWQAMGAFQYRRPTKGLPRAPVDGCFADNVTLLETSTENSPVSTSTQYSLFGNETELDSMNNGVESQSFSIYDLSYIWNPLIGISVTIIVGLITSVIASSFMSKKLRPEAKFIFPFCRRFWYSGSDVVAADMNMQDMDGEHE
ncbi:hypothetical protein RRG08_033941 [Elysia crispata]|uniref:Sodium-coupled monocarboxylate transporter 1 n=2 Tax=Elysia crispata TaxID=231223 RepID=A0AAE0YRU6_9GAST|nr:hypothetical protein RRG08_033941 [Elysia crispata]